MPVCGDRVGQPVYRETVIFDCENLGMKQFQMNALQYLKVVADIIQHYYPETLNKLFVVNAPHAFVTIWHVIRRWLEPRTIEKVCIVSKHATAATLLEDIDAENLPDFLGGKCTCSHIEGGCVPSIALGTVPRLEANSGNERVPTVYNTSIMTRKEVDDRT
ncbi:CRAL-TRIO domain-containing protein [Syncephalastrum racemosum]|uniref:CRAL-TRIO domain-containing protein n=1 Tax=Syncephalastrum racemosum TaxID=13706 RepID=A0A1X2H5M0_SYNRA|nr:CRAL-TRIO domain-containing protein [Syncephalastrum racemosum]